MNKNTRSVVASLWDTYLELDKQQTALYAPLSTPPLVLEDFKLPKDKKQQYDTFQRRKIQLLEEIDHAASSPARVEKKTIEVQDELPLIERVKGLSIEDRNRLVDREWKKLEIELRAKEYAKKTALDKRMAV